MKALDAVMAFFDGWKKRSKELKPSWTEGKEEWLRWLIGGLLVVVLVPMFPRGRSLQFADMKEGSISTRRIVAPFNFEILKTKEEYRRDRERASREVYPVFIEEDNKVGEVLGEIDFFFEEVARVRKEVLRNPSMKPVLTDSLFRKYPISVADVRYRDQFVDPRGVVDYETFMAFQETVKRVVRDVMAMGILSLEKARLEVPDRRVVVKEGEEEVIYPFGEFYDLPEARARSAELLNAEYSQRVNFSQFGFGVVSYFLRPNLIYDEATHQQRIADAEARVPLSSGFVYENEKIVDRNERITPEIRKKLVSLATKMAEMGMQERGIKRVFPLLGKVLFVVVLLFLLGAFIAIDRPELLKETKSVLLIALVIVLVSLMTFLIHRLDASEYLVPSALGVMLLATLFDTKVGFAGTAVMSVLVGGLWGNEFNLMAVSFFVGIVGVLAIKRVRGRRQLMQAIFSLAGAYALAITFMGFLHLLSLREIVKLWPYGALNGIFTPIVAYGLLPLVESVFDITTDFSLLELSNLNHPLLKRLSVQAPGTYHHSIIVGNLSEAAAQAVGANSLLARVGSYYHDIGKIEKSEYFVENQVGGENPHEKLTPRMSALILMKHVKRGLEIAEQFKLPKAIKDIVLQHQGTTMMSFFYQKAMQKNGSEETSENDYRYPGPRPQSKEAAIVMLADAVEAATRALKEPTHSRLRGVVEELVDERFQEGQLDESPLTLRDLERIKEAFLTILAGTFHTRVEYPEKAEEDSQVKAEVEKEESSES